MIYAEIKSPKEQNRLESALETSLDRKWYCRLIIIAHSAKKYTVAKLSEMFGLCQATVRNYIHAYNKGSLEQLQPKKWVGLPS